MYRSKTTLQQYLHLLNMIQVSYFFNLFVLLLFSYRNLTKQPAQFKNKGIFSNKNHIKGMILCDCRNLT